MPSPVQSSTRKSYLEPTNPCVPPVSGYRLLMLFLSEGCMLCQAVESRDACQSGDQHVVEMTEGFNIDTKPQEKCTSRKLRVVGDGEGANDPLGLNRAPSPQV